MGVPLPEEQPAVETTAEALFSAFTNIAAAERRRHASVYNYWLSIRGDRDFPAIQDLDPLEISDAGPCGVLLELIGAGEDAEIRHVGQALAPEAEVERISQVERPSLLACIADRLPDVASSRRPLAYEAEVWSGDAATRACITLLPFSSTGTWVDYVYGLVSPETAQDAGEAPEPVPAEEPEEFAGLEGVPESPEAPEEFAGQDIEPEAAEAPEEFASPAPSNERPGFSARFFESLASVEGFFGTVARFEPDTTSVDAANEPEVSPIDDEHETPAEAVADEDVTGAEAVADEDETAAEAVADEDLAAAEAVADEDVAAAEAVAVEEDIPAAEVADEEVEQEFATEGPLQSKLAEVRSKADEARAAKMRAEAALLEGLSAAYDFALDAEDQAEEYLRLLEERGLKIKLRSPMTPVVRLAFDGSCDEATIAELESVMAWALRMNVPRGSLAERIESEGGIATVLGGQAQAK